MEMPDLSTPDAGTTLVSEWVVGTPERQRAAADALLGEWRGLSRAFRPEAFVRLSCFARRDGQVLLSVAQWASDEAHLAFVREHRAAMVSRIDREVPGIGRPGLVRYRMLHAVVPDTVQEPGDAVVLLHARARSAGPARRWADGAAAGLRASRGVAAHILLSVDGLNALVHAPLARGGGPDPARLAATAAATTAAAAADTEVSVRAPEHYRLLGSVRGPLTPPAG